jgi:RNA polymerase sigma-70 factor (ECF subfamily)
MNNMHNSTPGDVTQLLHDCLNGDQDAFEELYQRYYHELHMQATSYLHRLPPQHQIQPTMIVDEVFLKLLRQQHLVLNDRVHFKAWSAKAMWHFIVSHARHEQAQSRGGHLTIAPLDEVDGAAQSPAVDVLAVREALQRLLNINPLEGQIVILRYFGGLTIPEVAQVLQLKPDRVKTLWNVAKAWLRLELTQGHCDGN